MLELKNIAVTFNAGTPMAVPALQQIDLVVPSGQFVTIIGSNGAGKSTMLKVIGGEVMADRGQVLIDGEDVTRRDAPGRAALVGKVFQDPRMGTCERMTIEENLAIAATRRRRRTLWPGVSRAFRAKFRDALAQLGIGLENRMKTRVGALSGGQRQALSLLMATVVETRVLLLDEHTAALDPRNAQMILDLSNKTIRDEKLTALMVTHSMRQSLDHGDRTIMMNEGRIVFDIQGEQRAGLDVPDLLALFQKSSVGEVDDDKLLLA